MRSSGDPVPSISEAAATGEIADLYADIRQTLGMTFVNLIWRNLASIPGALRWTWDTMKPLYANGAVYREADSLRQGKSYRRYRNSALLRCNPSESEPMTKMSSAQHFPDMTPAIRSTWWVLRRSGPAARPYPARVPCIQQAPAGRRRQHVRC
ncbi:hypothetical protein BZL30_5796 [Mycobacterium kansasii]|uniref:Uncharacterized protein n=1 Tax=Mycobacterium kansasii TaxID=1768 RepID=A0A1V3WZW7_MYCKA|nr:hypothetical protein BZL30_5796 [Mycobacterium kansasii]